MPAATAGELIHGLFSELKVGTRVASPFSFAQWRGMLGFMGTHVTIHRYADLAANRGLISSCALQTGLDAVFYQSSNTKSFANEDVRRGFRERWLGRYLEHDPQWAYVAVSQYGGVAGYLVGSLSDPALTQRFADIGYFARFADLTARYPAHLHVNLDESFRSGGIGSELVKRFCRDAAAAGSPGVHVVTSRGARNIGFYARNGFAEAGRDGDGVKEVVFLARDLKPD